MAVTGVDRPGSGFLERTFRLKENKSTVRTEVIAGLTTFMTMAYIIFVNPGIVQATGMPFEAVLIATVASAILGTLLMAFLANYPFALAPGMGLNAYFTFTVVLGLKFSWQTALGAVFISGVVFTILSLLRVREMIIDAVPLAIKNSIGAGIGLFIALIGMRNAGLIVPSEATLVTLGNVRDPAVLLAAFGIIVTAALMALNVRGSILLGILGTSVLAWVTGVAPAPTGIIQVPHLINDWAPIFGQLDIGAAIRTGLLDVIFVFLFVDMFDTVGTLIGVSTQGGFLDAQGRLPRAQRALLADALATVGGSVFGTPTVTSYIESASGVAAGGRTGLVGVVVSAAFLLSLLFTPLIKAVPAAATAPALILVGALMIRSIVNVDWKDFSEAVPAFLAVIAMPFTFSIATGIALAFISYPLIKLLSGKGRQVHWLLYVLAFLFILRFAWLRA